MSGDVDAMVGRLEHCSRHTTDEYLHELAGRAAAMLRAQQAENERLNQTLADCRTMLAATGKAAAEHAAESARLREALRVLRDLPIVENDNHDTLHIEGMAYTGPAVDFLFRAVRMIKEVARAALAGGSDGN